jgi:hypothetical protein
MVTDCLKGHNFRLPVFKNTGVKNNSQNHIDVYYTEVMEPVYTPVSVSNLYFETVQNGEAKKAEYF